MTDADTADTNSPRASAEGTGSPSRRAAAKKTPAPKSTAKKAAGKKATAKKTTAKKTTAKKGAAAKTSPRRSTPQDAPVHEAAEGGGPRHEGDESGRRSGGSTTGPRAPRVAAMAAEQLVELTGKHFEGVVGLSRSDDGWRVEVEVLEVRRIPNTTDVLAIFEVEVDPDGELTGYRRLRRYLRGEAREDR